MTRGMVIADYLWGAFFLLLILAALRTKKTQQRENVASRLSYTVIIALGFALMFWVNVGFGALDVRVAAAVRPGGDSWHRDYHCRAGVRGLGPACT